MKAVEIIKNCLWICVVNCQGVKWRVRTTKNTNQTLKSEVKDVFSPAKTRVTRDGNPPIKVYFLADFRGRRWHRFWTAMRKVQGGDKASLVAAWERNAVAKSLPTASDDAEGTVLDCVRTTTAVEPLQAAIFGETGCIGRRCKN